MKNVISQFSEQEEIAFLKRILSLIPCNVYWKDRNGVFLGCNNNVAKILNLDSPDDIVGKQDQDLYDLELAMKARAADQEVIKSEKEYNVEEIGLNLKGEKAVYLSSKVPLRDASGRVIGLLGVSIDISERKKSEELMKHAKEEAESANKLKSEFIRHMEHDIRTPFNGILGISNYLASIEQELEKKELLEDIANSTQELLDYCNEILDFSRIESGSLPIIEKKFDLRQLIDTVVTMEKLSAKVKNIDFFVEIAPDLPQFIIGDRYRIHRILINLLSNAIKFTSKGHIALKVALAKQVSTRQIILSFTVQDSGPGIPLNKQNIIYERFTRISPEDETNKGQGLGLRIVKRFVDEMDGDIEIKSEINKGTEFICTLQFKLPHITSIL